MTFAPLGLLLIAAPLPPAAGGAVKDLVPSARLALHGFMVNCPEPVPGRSGLLRASFGCNALPWPVVGHAQWDWGDCTGRAVQAWLFARRMTGEADFGRPVEEGQRATLLWLLTPTRGMPCVPDLSDPDRGVYHYQMWDQGRTLRALVRWWLSGPDARLKTDLQARIRKMISSLDAVATHGHDPEYGDYAVYPWDNITETTVAAGGPAHIVPGQDLYIMRGGQLLEPLALYWAASDDPEAGRFARQICAGVISGHEADTYQGSSSFRFGPDGSFGGHFHDHASIALGVAQLGAALVARGEREEGLRLLRWAKTVYDWTLSPGNVNAGSTWGWFPENVGSDNTQAREVCEICCTADMIQLAAALAGAARLDASLSSWDALWDHVERYTLNTILPAQFRVTGRYLLLLRRASAAIGNGYVGFELDPNGCYSHEVVGHQTLATDDGGHVSQILYGVAYDAHKAFFAWPGGGRPMEPHGFVSEAPTAARGDRLVGAVRTTDGAVRIEHETCCGEGPDVTTRFTVTNASAAPIGDARLAYFVNLDYPDWQRNLGRTELALGRVTVRSTAYPGALGMSGDPAPAYATVGDAAGLMQAFGAFDWSAPVATFSGNAAGELGWDLGTLAPGETKAVTVTLAAASAPPVLDRALAHEAFPPRSPSSFAPAMAAAHRLEGAWIAAFQPNDLALRGADGHPYANMMGCCHPAGVRGLFACWQSVFGDDGQTLRSRLPICRAGGADAARQWVTEGPWGVEQRIRLLSARHVIVRLPDWASAGTVAASLDGRPATFTAEGRWLHFGRLESGAVLTLTYPMVWRSTQERVGGNGKTDGFCPPAEKRWFTALWRGNVVVGMDPPGELLPLWPSVAETRRVASPRPEDARGPAQ